jgi:hypothetical protein
MQANVSEFLGNIPKTGTVSFPIVSIIVEMSYLRRLYFGKFTFKRRFMKDERGGEEEGAFPDNK